MVMIVHTPKYLYVAETIFFEWKHQFVRLELRSYILCFLRQDRACKRVIWRDGEYTNNILRRNKFIMTA